MEWIHPSAMFPATLLVGDRTRNSVQQLLHRPAPAQPLSLSVHFERSFRWHTGSIGLAAVPLPPRSSERPTGADTNDIFLSICRFALDIFFPRRGLHHTCGGLRQNRRGSLQQRYTDRTNDRTNNRTKVRATATPVNPKYFPSRFRGGVNIAQLRSQRIAFNGKQHYLCGNGLQSHPSSSSAGDTFWGLTAGYAGSATLFA